VIRRSVRWSIERCGQPQAVAAVDADRVALIEIGGEAGAVLAEAEGGEAQRRRMAKNTAGRHGSRRQSYPGAPPILGIRRRSFPRGYRSFHCLEYRVRRDPSALPDQFALLDPPQVPGVPAAQFLFEVQEFKYQLPLGDLDGHLSAARRNFRNVEIIPAVFGFIGYAPKIRGDRADRIAGLSKSFKLGMMAIACGCSEQHLLGEQAFPPKSDEAYAVQQ
jgi:hypothetical protein